MKSGLREAVVTFRQKGGNYRRTLSLATTLDKVLEALTEKIPIWWTATFDGAASEEGHSLTVRFERCLHNHAHRTFFLPY